MTRRILINAVVIILILFVWMMVAGSIATDLVILGQSLAAWSVLITVVGGVYLYRQLLTFLRARAHPPESQPTKSTGPFSSIELERYARHIMMREIGGTGQKRLKDAKVLVVGAGGLGAPALQYLAAAGVGTIGVIDDDTVENANLQRQVIHTEEGIGTHKVFSAKAQMLAQNPHVEVKPYNRRLDEEIAEELIADYDLILEGSDNFETRYLVNKIAVVQQKPMVSGALSQWEGQISVFDPARKGPCYQCIFPEKPADGLAPSCAEAGVFAPLPGVIGTMMAGEAMKLILKTGATLTGSMFIYDAHFGVTRQIRLNKRTDCPICSEQT
jgi:molybdopterin/thiamine biosynthesis adenylyltransferase